MRHSDNVIAPCRVMLNTAREPADLQPLTKHALLTCASGVALENKESLIDLPSLLRRVMLNTTRVAADLQAYGQRVAEGVRLPRPDKMDPPSTS